MLCSQCRIPTLDGKCPNCGKSYRSDDHGQSSSSEQPIRFDILTSTRKTGTTSDWRAELKRRVDEHTAKKSVGEEFYSFKSELDKPDDQAHSSSPEEPTEARSPLFEYKLRQITEQSAPKRPIEPREEPIEKPSKARPEQTRPTSPSIPLETTPDPPRPQEPFEIDTVGFDLEARVPQQKDLDLAPLLPIELEEESIPEAMEEPLVEEAGAPPESREILLSRILSGIIDLTLPILLALGFTVLASWIRGFDIFMQQYLLWVAGIGLVFYFFNSVFFLILTRQTLGMYFTDLKLASDEGTDELPLASILFRVFLFLPAAVSVIGLVWAVFDPLRRCVHDVLSGTVVTRV